MSRAFTTERIKGFTLFSTQGNAPSQEDFTIAKKDRGLFVVADGFGGMSAGIAASKIACDSVLQFLEREAGDIEATLPFVLRSYFSLAGNVLFNALIHANRNVFNFNKGKALNEKGGSSCVAGFLDEDLLALANIGCCSVYLIRSGKIQELVTPRSYAKLCNPMDEDPEAGLAIPLMSMGMSEDLEPEIIEFRVQPGDWVVLQTDGVRSEMRKELLKLHTEQNIKVEDRVSKIQCEDNASFALIQF